MNTTIKILIWSLLFCFLNAGILSAGISDAINLQIGEVWGNPQYSQYIAIRKTSEWRYNREEATLIITKTECPECQPVSRCNIDEYNDPNDSMTSAIMINHKGIPAMLRLYASPKGVYFRVFQINVNGYSYGIQLGINHNVSQQASFKAERDFFNIINSFIP